MESSATSAKVDVKQTVPKLNTVVIALSDSKHAEYAFEWALGKHSSNAEHMLQYGDVESRRVLLVTCVEAGI
jgi:hypothetical protein